MRETAIVDRIAELITELKFELDELNACGYRVDQVAIIMIAPHKYDTTVFLGKGLGDLCSELHIISFEKTNTPQLGKRAHYHGLGFVQLPSKLKAIFYEPKDKL